jgi:hypothetical protein
VYMTVKGHRNGAYLGTESRRFNLRPGYSYRGGTSRRHEVWRVDGLRSPSPSQ